MLEYRDKGNYLLHEFVVMPNHLHILITPGNSVSLERAMQLIKGGSSHEIHKVRRSNISIWQSGFHESRVRDAADYNNKRDYIYFNPITAKLVDRPEQWRYSSASGNYQLDPIPQRLKPLVEQAHVGAEAPTPNTGLQVPRVGAKARFVAKATQGLKPLPPKEESPFAANLKARRKGGA